MRHRWSQDTETYKMRGLNQARRRKYGKNCNFKLGRWRTVWSTTVGLAFLTSLTHKVRLGPGITKTVLLLTTFLIDIRAGTNVSNEDYSNSSGKCIIKRLESPNFGMTTREVINMENMIPLTVPVGDSQDWVRIEVARILALNALLGTTCCDKCIRGT